MMLPRSLAVLETARRERHSTSWWGQAGAVTVRWVPSWALPCARLWWAARGHAPLTGASTARGLT